MENSLEDFKNFLTCVTIKNRKNIYKDELPKFEDPETLAAYIEYFNDYISDQIKFVIDFQNWVSDNKSPVTRKFTKKMLEEYIKRTSV